MGEERAAASAVFSAHFYYYYAKPLKLVEVYDEMENYLPSLLELFRIIESRELNKDGIINVLQIINTAQLPYLQKRVG